MKCMKTVRKAAPWVCVLLAVLMLVLMLAALVFATLVGLVAGILPANKAVKISALEAIRHE